MYIQRLQHDIIISSALLFRIFGRVVRATGWHAGDPCSDPRQGQPLYIWMYTPSAVSIFGWICALYKSTYFFFFFVLVGMKYKGLQHWFFAFCDLWRVLLDQIWILNRISYLLITFLTQVFFFQLCHSIEHHYWPINELINRVSFSYSN
jgi:hypothetical protein